jgi:hypothetical protein
VGGFLKREGLKKAGAYFLSVKGYDNFVYKDKFVYRKLTNLSRRSLSVNLTLTALAGFVVQ